MHAAALNRGEFVLGHGLHGKAGTWKAIGGEGAGEVVAVGRTSPASSRATASWAGAAADFRNTR
jgi:hypothetical protein